MNTVIEMAREAGLKPDGNDWGANVYRKAIEAFAELVREEATAEANARANASWTLMCEKMVAIEREACVKVCEEYDGEYDIHPKQTAEGIALQIRARGQA
ncbi:hypothetical protein UFOVP133_2 [uncultured Caudovirales phage]|uniref:Uncharacterized protein n=1 Tax=uncultured Caudovirales phage TaxID=2100421 RepID=A0A6J5L994_9CAUD|nr:hypothetical protein UFOVP133_2 [uncultured Caudovirales phage]